MARKQRNDSVDEEMPAINEQEENSQEFFDFIATREPVYWEHHRIYWYRSKPEVRSKNKAKYIAIFDHAVTEDELARHPGGGGGVYYFILKNMKTREIVRSCIFEIDGDPNILQSQELVDKRFVGKPDPSVSVPPATTVAAVTTPDQMISLVREIVNKEGQSPQDAMKQTLELLTMAKALQAPPTASAASDPFRDEMMKMMMAKMLKDEPSPSSDLKDILVAINNKLDRPQPSNFDFMKIMTGIPVFSAAFEEITGRGLMDVVGAVFGRGGAAVATEAAAKQGIMGWLQGGGLQEILEKAPTLMKTFDEMSANSMQRAVALENWKIQMAERQAAIAAGQTPPAQVIPPQPAAQPPAQPAKVITIQPAAASAQSSAASGTVPTAPMRGASIPFGAPATATANPSNGHSAPPSNLIETELVDQNGDNVTVTPEALAQAQEMQMAFFLELIVRSYRAGDGGGDVADMLIDLYPDILAQQLPMFKMAGPAQVIAWAASNPILSEIAADKEFPNFIDDFLHKVKKWEPEPASATDPVATA